MASRPEAAPTEPASSSTDGKPTRVLPTNRVSFSKQLVVLRAFGSAYAQSGKGAPIADAAKLAQIHPGTVTLITPFFTDIAFLERSGQLLVPSVDVQQFQRAYSWKPETAAQRLAPTLRRTWFANVLLPMLSMGPLEEKEAIGELAVAASASAKYEGQLKTLIDYLDAAGLVRREGALLRQGPNAGGAAQMEVEPETEAGEPAATSPQPRTAAPAASIATAFAQTSGGGVRFKVDVDVDMAEFGTWSADRIAAFFAGIAQVLAAKSGIEQGGM